MGSGEESNKSRYSRNPEKKRRKHGDGSTEHSQRKKHKHGKKTTSGKLNVVDDDADENVWVEKNIDMDGERIIAADIPTAESLKITSTAAADGKPRTYSPTSSTETRLKRDEWMILPSTSASSTAYVTPTAMRPQVIDVSLTDGYGESSEGSRNFGGGVDFFSSLGTEHKRPNPKANRPDIDKPMISSKELNQNLIDGKHGNVDVQPQPTRSITPGGPGSQWRMMRLRRVYETAAEEGISVEEVAIERFGSLVAFEEAKKERRILDERESKRGGKDRGRETERQGGERRFMFTNDASGSSSRSSSFRRPGGVSTSQPSTPSPPSDANRKLSNHRLDSLRRQSQAASPLSQSHSHTPIPTVMTPRLASSKTRGLSPSSLNRLQAKVLRAKLMGATDAGKLEKEYEAEARKAHGADDSGHATITEVQVLPTLDARGRMYDVGLGRNDAPEPAGNRKKKEKHFETHDPKTGEVIRINPDDDTMTLGEMLRQERFGAGMADQKNIDAQFARAIMGDGKFENDLDYIDDNAERLARQKMRSDAMKRQFAIHDYKRTQKVLSSCSFCYGEDDSLPKAGIIAMGTKVYLSCTTNEELVKGHCLIVPMQHHLTMLEGDDDMWDEVRNFMKCLMRMFADEDNGVLFYETVISLKRQNHTFIECVPLPWEHFDLIPGYFKESILTSETEWSQHKKLIDFSVRRGGFRRAMVPNLPYFMVQFDYKGEKGYGHVIEGTGDVVEEGEEGMDEGEKGSGEFPRYFAGEIIGNVLGIEPRRWRRPRRVDFSRNRERVAQFRKKYAAFDWTKMLTQ